MDFIYSIPAVIVVLLFYIVFAKLWMILAAFIGRALGISRLVEYLLHKFTKYDL